MYLFYPATCRGGQSTAANFADGNCRTYWDCAQGHPHPVCCKPDHRFDVFTLSCIPDVNCTDECPMEYTGKLYYDLRGIHLSFDALGEVNSSYITRQF